MHVAIIMNGNMRWAARRGLPHSAHDRVVQSSWRSAHPHAAEQFSQSLREIDQTALSAGAVDLLIRTGGGECHSDFMLWEVAYARLHSADCLWPDFTSHDFARALEFHSTWMSAR
jgi:undecaprenyl diphosphate synthase